MDCRHFRRNHLAYVDGSLSQPERELMRDHADSCGACSTHDTRVRRSLMIAHNLPAIQPSPGFAERLEQRLREAKAIDLREWSRSARGVRGPGIGEFLAAAAGVVAAGLVATAAIDRFRSHEIPVMPPVLAAAAESPTLPLTVPAFVASASPIVAVWPAALLLDQAPMHFSTASLPAAQVR